jgi:hypothetical protein
MSPDFELFIGIDWSGAKGSSHRGIAVSEAEAGQSVPSIISPPADARSWSRTSVTEYLIKKSGERKTLAGIDFAFCYPFIDENTYFPGMQDAPASAPELWALIDRINAEATDLYGGLIWKNPEFAAYYNAPAIKGHLFRSRRRQTEIAAKPIKSPSPTFNCVGPAGVGTGSLAGMRMLHKLEGQACRWPIETNTDKSLTLVEIFPSFYFSLAGVRPIKGNHARLDMLNKALAFFGSNSLPDGFVAKGPDFDEADALISSAAIRALASKPEVWSLPSCAIQEGWIFGVE